MKYLNAKKGFNKLFVAAMLMIIAEIIAFFVFKVWWLIFISTLIIIVSFFINLSGLSLISKDDDGYSKAYVWAMMGIIITIVGAVVLYFIKDNATAYKYCYTFLKVGPKVCDYISIYYIISASVDIAKSLNNVDLAVCAKSTLSLHLVVYAISIIISLILNFGGNFLVVVIPTIILTLIESVLTIVAKIKYYIFLKRMANSL